MRTNYFDIFLEDILGVPTDIEAGGYDNDIEAWHYVLEKEHDKNYDLFELAEQYEGIMNYLDQNEYPDFVRDVVHNEYHDKAQEIFLEFDFAGLQDEIDRLIANAKEVEAEYRHMNRMINRQGL
jgi:hypothetical protein